MVDEYLPERQETKLPPLGKLFLDFNSFFASVEQQERPELRGQPVIVVPMETDSTSAIAASYEAKALGIKTGTPVHEARRICPTLNVVAARPRVYKGYHEAIREVGKGVLPEYKVHSIDEMSYQLIGQEREPAHARALAQEMKSRLQSQIGPCMTCSIGIAPNLFLAKMATELEKPDGLVILEAKDLPGPMLRLKLTDYCGINKRMAARLNGAFIFTAKDLYHAGPKELARAFGSIVGERWWYLLRGYDWEEPDRPRQSLGHSHVLPPDLRNDAGVKEVLLRLIQKAAMRLRAENLYAGAMSLSVSGKVRRWDWDSRIAPTNDSLALNEYFLGAWSSRNFQAPLQVGVGFTHLQLPAAVTPSLFDDEPDRTSLNQAVDNMNHKFGKNSLYLASMSHAKESADEKIAFDKTWLLSEGKGDNDWIDTFRGLIEPKPYPNG